MKTITVHYTVRQEDWYCMELEVPDEISLSNPADHEKIEQLLYDSDEFNEDANYDKERGQAECVVGEIEGEPPEGAEDEGELELPEKSYVVTWAMDIDADDVESAARQAWAHMRRPDSTANVFDVRVKGAVESVCVDVGKLDAMEE
jgi:hypothetical protein